MKPWAKRNLRHWVIATAIYLALSEPVSFIFGWPWTLVPWALWAGYLAGYTVGHKNGLKSGSEITRHAQIAVRNEEVHVGFPMSMQ